jgi:hypothetical protein
MGERRSTENVDTSLGPDTAGTLGRTRQAVVKRAEELGLTDGKLKKILESGRRAREEDLDIITPVDPFRDPFSQAPKTRRRKTK